MYEFRPAAILAYASLLPEAILTTLGLTASVFILAFPPAFALARARRGRSLVLGLGARCWIELFRNVPILVLLYTCFFGLAELGLLLANWEAALLALTLNASAYLAEIIRAGYAAIAPGQVEAARALGLRPFAIEWKVLAPQAFRAALPALGNQAIGILLGSAAAAVIGVHDLGDWMLATGSSSFRYMEAFLAAALLYIGLAQALASGFAALERRSRRRPL
ncbi:MAG: ABC transporter permease subunit [Acetobacteraceae bacterium]|nr:ABC transporter permease subunit [Acetobacteraceae bacterium]